MKITLDENNTRCIIGVEHWNSPECEIEMALAFSHAVKECIKHHGKRGPSNCDWAIIYPLDPGEAQDPLGNVGFINWKLR